jgi:hypothetical protein
LSSMLFSLFAIKARTYYSSPEEDLLESFNSDNEMYYVRIAEKVVPTMLNTIRDNYNVNNSKGRWISKSWICLIIGIGSIVVYAGIFLATREAEESQIKITLSGNSTSIKEFADAFHLIGNMTAKAILYCSYYSYYYYTT